MVSESNEGSPSEPIRLNLFVFWSSAISIGIFGLLFVLFPQRSQFWLTYIQGQANQLFGWYYMLVIVVCLGFVAWLAFSRVGQIPLGKDDDKPEFDYLAWVSMLFSAGIGIALLYYGVAEPVDHFIRPPEGQGGTIQAARDAMMYSFLHWGIHGWVLYALLGVTLGYFAFRQNLPLALRSALYPIFGERIHGLIGDFVDGFGILATVISLVTNLGIGALVLVSGVHYLLPEIPNNQTTLTTVVMVATDIISNTTVIRVVWLFGISGRR